MSPFVSLPRATTLPYTYKTLPSTLPPPPAGSAPASEPPGLVVSASSGHAAHPDEIIESCRGLLAHLERREEAAERAVREWEQGIRERELAEKRSLAPGWLDREEKLLQPERPAAVAGDLHTAALGFDAQGQGQTFSSASPSSQHQRHGPSGNGGGGGMAALPAKDEGEELDRAFGVLGFGA